MKRVVFRKIKKHKKYNIIFITIIMSIIISIFLVHFIDKKITPILFKYSSGEARRFSNILINGAIDDEVLEKINDDEIFNVSKNNSEEIQMVSLNTSKINEVLEFINNKITSRLKNLEEGNIRDLEFVDTFKGSNFKNTKRGVVCEVPFGIVFSSSLLSNMGPIIPVKLSFIGDVTTELKTNLKNYGINNVYVSVLAHIEVREKITMPISTKEVLVSLDIPLTAKMIQGKVPLYFSSGNNDNSNLFSLPKEK